MLGRLSRLDRYLISCALGAMAVATTAMVLALNPSASDYRTGDLFATVRGFQPSRFPATIAILLNTNCGACREAAGVFQRVAQKPRSFQVLVAGYEPEAVIQDFLTTRAIDADVVSTLPAGLVHLSAVPRLLLLDRGGRIAAVWAGSTEIVNSEAAILTLSAKLTQRAEPPPLLKR